MLGPSSELQLEVLYLGLCDEEDDVRAHAVSSLPFIALSSSFHALPCVFARLESLGKEKCEKVKKGRSSYDWLSVMPVWPVEQF
ncbi:hypothetical protein V2J09_021565 [Rumex salicifolius]